MFLSVSIKIICFYWPRFTFGLVCSWILTLVACWSNFTSYFRCSEHTLTLQFMKRFLPDFLYPTYRKVLSTEARYWFRNQLFVKRSQYIRIENSLHKQSEKACMCFNTRRAGTGDCTVFVGSHAFKLKMLKSITYLTILISDLMSAMHILKV